MEDLFEMTVKCKMFRGQAVLLLFSMLRMFPSQSIVQLGQGYRTLKHDKSLPLRDLKPLPRQFRSSDPDADADAAPRVARLFTPALPKPGSPTKIQDAMPRQLSVSAGLNVEGIDADGSRATPDTSGAVGKTQYVQWVNLQFAVFDKSSGDLLFGPAYGHTLWSGFGGPCESDDDGDIVAQYDKIAGVWVMTQHAVKGGPPFYQCVAVSTSSDATGTWYRYAFALPDNFPDYPKLGVWPDAYYLTLNEQDPNTFANLGAYVCALDRQSMLTGAAASAQCFQLPATYTSLLPSDLDGSIPPPAGSPNYLLNRGTNSLNLWKFHVDWQTPANTTLSGPTRIPVAQFTSACKGSGLCAPQMGTSQLLDGIGDRLMYRVGYRRFADGHESLVASHSVGTPSGIRWYEIQNPGGTPEIFQQSTFAPDSNYRWMPSIAMDQMSDIAVGYSVSSSSMLPAIRYTGRLQSDPLNTMEGENSVIEGQGNQQGSNRWGDYSSMSIDPMDDCTFYYTNQYQASNGSYNWHTRITSFKYTSCSSNPPVTLAPNGLFFGSYTVGTMSLTQAVTLTNNQTVALNLTGINVSGDFSQINTCGSSVVARGTCTLTVSFTPTAVGTRTGQIVINDDAAGSPQVVNLTGTGGTPIVALGQTSLSFRALLGSTTSAKSVKLTNNGSAPLTISSIVASGDYSWSGNCVTVSPIAPGLSCSINVTFTPTVTGTIPGDVSISDNAPGAPHLINLTGAGLTTLSVAPTSLTFGTISVGSTSAAQTVTIANNAGAQSFSYGTGGNFRASSGGSTPCGPSPVTLGASSHCTLSIFFSPTSNGTIKGALTVTDTASGVAFNPQIVDLSGSGTSGVASPLSSKPATLGFGNVAVGGSLGPKTLTITNSTANSISILGLAASGNFALAATGKNPCTTNTVLAANQSCTLSVTFTPSVQGNQSGSITITDNAAVGPTTQVFDLSGTGVWPIVLSPSSLTFSAQSVGTTSAAQVVTLTNYSSRAVNINGIAPSGDYSVVSGGASPCGSTVSSATGQTPGSCTFAVTFTPTAKGLIQGVVTVSHNATGNNSPQVVSLSGTGQ
jgi:hypothetical protein